MTAESPEQENKLIFDKYRSKIESSILKKIKKCRHKKEELESLLTAYLSWEDIKYQAELLKTQTSKIKRGAHDVEVWDWINEKAIKIALDPSKTVQEQVNSLFKKSRKFHSGIIHVREQIKKIEVNMEALQIDLDALKNVSTLDALLPLKEKWITPVEQGVKPSKAIIKPRLPYYEFISASGIKILVGRSAKDNDKLTFHYANGLDWWLHAHENPGSHIVIRGEPDVETLADALQLALYYSRAKKQDEVEVVVTQRKFVSRFGRGGHAGKVQISKHKTMRARKDEERMKQIKERIRINEL